MTDKERERQIAHYAEMMRQAWESGNRAEAKFFCRVMTGLIRGRSQEIVEAMEQTREKKGIA
jgi:hypothetical protein